MVRNDDAIVPNMRIDGDDALSSHCYYPECSHVFGVQNSFQECERTNTSGTQTLASAWVPSDVLRSNALFLRDMRSNLHADVYAVMLRIMALLPHVLFNSTHDAVTDVAVAQTSSSSTRSNFYCVSFWARTHTRGSSPGYASKCTSDAYAAVCAGASITLHRHVTGTRRAVHNATIRDACDAIDINMSACETASAAAKAMKRASRKRRRSKSARTPTQRSDVPFSSHAPVMDAARHCDDGDLSIVDVVNAYMKYTDDSMRKTRGRPTAYDLLSVDTQLNMRRAAVGASDDESHFCIQSFCVPSEIVEDGRVFNVLLPHVSIPIVNFVTRLHSCLSEYTYHAEDCGGDIDIARSSGHTESVSDTMTHERRIAKLHQTLSAVSWELQDVVQAESIVVGIERATHRLMFNLYCAMCRGVDDSTSRVAECLHRARLQEKVDTIPHQTLARYGTQTRVAAGASLTAYDWYRSAFMRDLVHVFSARTDIVALVQFFIENATCAYNHNADEMTNVVTMGKSGCGKDYLLLQVERTLVEGTVQKVSRSTPGTASVECLGRDDGLIVYNPEKGVENIYKSRARGNAGDSMTKDIQSSGYVVTKRFRYDRQGRRSCENTVNARRVLEYNAMNCSSLSRVDEGIFQRSIWVSQPPPTDSTQCAILSAVYKNKPDEQQRSSQAHMAFLRCQRFLQLASFEVHQLMALGCMRSIVTEGAEVVLMYISQRLAEKRNVYGCTASVYRRYKQVMSLAREHAIRRVTVNAFFSSEGKHFGQPVTPVRLSTLNYYVGMADLSLALGQMAEYMGIFKDGEIQIIMALRFLWITNKHRHAMFASESTGGVFRLSLDVENEPCPRYVRFKGTINDIARECVGVLARVWARERGAPAPLSLEMAVDALKRITCTCDDADEPPTVSLDDDCIRFNDDFSKVLENARQEAYALVPGRKRQRLPQKMVNSTAPQNGATRDDSARNLTCEFNAVEELVPVLELDAERRKSVSSSDDMMQLPQAVVKRGERCIHVHVAYLTRLFDPKRRYWPWTQRKPTTWGPQINEHTLVMNALEMLRSYRYQAFPTRVMYRMVYGKSSAQKSSQHGASSSADSRAELDVDYVTRKHTINNRRLAISAPFTEEDDPYHTSGNVELHAPLDLVSMYASKVGWKRAVYMSANAARWKRVVDSGDLTN